jgi:hypothetical protein
MIIHSIVPMDVIFNNMEDCNGKPLEIEYMGEKIEVMPLSNNQYKISRLLSTSPKAYLNPLFQPGNIITGIDLEKNQKKIR